MLLWVILTVVTMITYELFHYGYVSTVVTMGHITVVANSGHGGVVAWARD